MGYTTLQVHQEGALLEVVLHRPEALNALNSQMLDELEAVLQKEAAAKDVRAIVFRGSGEKAFAAGADVREMEALSPWEFYLFLQRGHQVLGALARFPKPTIASIHGYCLGGGLELALACDIRIGSPEARLGFPEVKLGILPGWGGTKRLVDAVGPGRAKELAMTGRMVDGAAAERMGLLHRLAPSREELASLTRSVAGELAGYNPTTLRLIKGAIHEAPHLSWEGVAEMEARSNALCLTTGETRASLKAFMEKRRPRP